MTNLVPLHQAGAMAPTKMRSRIASGQAINSNFADGVPDAFRVLSIKGKVFTARFEGKGEIYKDPQTGLAYNSLDVVLVNASRQLAKSYYAHGYSEGDLNPPDCWSMDSVRPDPSVANKVNPTCTDCPKNAFGSRITDAGKAAKECSDARRVAITLPHHLAEQDPSVLLLRVPQSSLKNMKNYVELLARNGYEPGGCVTRLSFDPMAAFPKIVFTFVGPVTDAEFDTIEGLSNSTHVGLMLRSSEFDNVASAGNIVNPSMVAPQQRQAPPVTDSTGFGAGMLQQPVQRPVQQAVPEQEEEEEEPGALLIELPDGEGWLNTVTGEITKPAPVAKAAELDPDVIAVKDGRFFNKRLGKFVATQFKTAPANEEPAKPARKPRTTKPKLDAAPAQQTEQVQQAEPEQEEPQQKPMVVAASPELNDLISGLKNKQPSGNA